MTSCQPKCPNSHRWVTQGHLPSRETEIKPDSEANTAHTTILPSRSTTHRRLVFPKILRHARHLDLILLNWIIYHFFQSNHLFISRPWEPPRTLGPSGYRKTIVCGYRQPWVECIGRSNLRNSTPLSPEREDSDINLFQKGTFKS